ncbi:SSU ribosomal protein S9P [Punctularia strigosozonata HHB-11173 SS5]|uniref:SSU ribosomal protein S9P n=1 Tax=Punctularia strigosozonata (strain HHB-11173) TaxID=741275 RepID=UPI0004416263|nr:SSU ribosomal protein S9P [Punctularia strigosozonata HHB-11173 SS5]EIN11763.1 SSU ribosomal protein S9P [Punctularia strigosozonata HHB-11173 SS5]
MNVLRALHPPPLRPAASAAPSALRVAACRRVAPARSYAAERTPFVPPAAADELGEDLAGITDTVFYPPTPTFYTGRSHLYDQLAELQRATSLVNAGLRQLHLFPLPPFALASLPSIQTFWLPHAEMSAAFETKLSISRYRQIVSLLNELDRYRSIAEVAGHAEYADKIGDLLSLYESTNKSQKLRQNRGRKPKFDEWGRSYTLGKRKESAARVWMIPVQGRLQGGAAVKHASSTSLTQLSPRPESISTTTILINNVPLAQYFPIPADRERIVRPLKLAGVLGAYNVFALVRGGGTSGQSGAVAHGVALGIAAHEPDQLPMLRKSKVAVRDPRQVERKKTGLLKARKARTWVKR